MCAQTFYPYADRDRPAPSYEDWVAYCFEQGRADFQQELDDSPAAEAAQQRYENHTELPLDALMTYITRLFTHAAPLADRYTDQQLNEGIWFLFFNIVTECFRELSLADQITWVRAMEPLYKNFLDQVCCQRRNDADGDYVCTQEENTLDVAVFMIWHLQFDCFRETRLIVPHDLRNAAVDVLETILFESRTSTCVMSALHGLGHSKLRKRAVQIINRFLEQTQQPDWIRDYALQARSGKVM